MLCIHSMSDLRGLPVSFVCGIYGYHITHPIDLPCLDLRIEPFTGDYTNAKLRTDNHQSYQLTAILKGKRKSTSDHFLFNLEAILSFIESRDVLITPAEELINEESPFSQFPESIAGSLRGKASKAAIFDDTLNPTARTSFIIAALTRFNSETEKLENEAEKTLKIPLFNSLFFKYVELFRQNTMFPEISYYLLFSGLEAFAMSWANKVELFKKETPEQICEKCMQPMPNKRSYRSASYAIYKFLKKDGDVFGATDSLKADKIDIKTKIPIKYDKYAAMAAYAELRNKLFHVNEFKGSIKKGEKETVSLDLFDYLRRLELLVQLVILKEVGFDDGDTNYKAWLSLQ